MTTATDTELARKTREADWLRGILIERIVAEQRRYNHQAEPALLAEAVLNRLLSIVPDSDDDVFVRAGRGLL